MPRKFPTLTRALRRDRRARLMLALPLAMLALIIPWAAQAHPGHGAEGAFASGLMHPLGGADHWIAMLAVGLAGGVMGGRAALALPLAFVAAMLAAGIATAGGLALPLIEPLILASLVVLGAALMLALRPALPLAVAAVALFGAAHGAAHGAEGPGSGLVPYALGFVLSTAALHGAGLALARRVAPVVARVLGGGALVAGMALALG